jgi:hypothetical protein
MRNLKGERRRRERMHRLMENLGHCHHQGGQGSNLQRHQVRVAHTDKEEITNIETQCILNLRMDTSKSIQTTKTLDEIKALIVKIIVF